MSDSFSSVSSESWFSRLGKSIIGVLIGIVLFFVAFPVLFMNEWRSVTTIKAIAEVQKTTQSIPADKVDSANEKALVHLTGEATTDETLADEPFGMAQRAIKLKRVVEMYQWVEEKHEEKKKKTGGSEETITTYTYKKQWSDGFVDSSGFQKSAEHENPKPAYDSLSIQAKTTTLAAFTLSDALVGQINAYTDLPVTADAHAKLPAAKKAELKIQDGKYYRPYAAKPQDDAPKPVTTTAPATDAAPAEEGAASTTDATQSPAAEESVAPAADVAPAAEETPYTATPELGDLRIGFQIVKPQAVSVIAVQMGDTFAAYQAKAGRSIEWLYVGTLTVEEMCNKKKSENTMWTWILRAVGFAMMFFGITMVFQPLSVLADVIPFIGNIVGAGVFMLALIIATPLTLLTIAVSWIVVRPLIGIALLVVAIAIIIGGIKLLKGRSQKATK